MTRIRSSAVMPASEALKMCGYHARGVVLHRGVRMGYEAAKDICIRLVVKHVLMVVHAIAVNLHLRVTCGCGLCRDQS